MSRAGNVRRVFSIVFVLLFTVPETLRAAPIRPAPAPDSSLIGTINRQEKIRILLRKEFVVLEHPAARGDSLDFRSYKYERLRKTGGWTAVPPRPEIAPPVRLSELSQVQVRGGWSPMDAGVGLVLGSLFGMLAGGGLWDVTHDDTHGLMDLEELDYAFAGMLVGAVAGTVYGGELGRSWKTVYAAPDSASR